MDRQCGLFLALFRAMVGDREDQNSHRPEFVLVAEPDRLSSAPALWPPPAGFSLYLRLCLHLDSIHSEPDHQLSNPARDIGLPTMRRLMHTALALLFAVRHTAVARCC